MSSLYQIQNDILQLRNLLEVEEEFADESSEKEQIEQQLAIKRDELLSKVEAYAHVINQTEAQIEMAQKEIQRITDFVLRKKHISDRLNGALLAALLDFGDEDKTGVKRLEIGTLRLSTRKSSFVTVLDEDAVPADCKLVDVSFKNLSVEIATFLGKRLHDLPESVGKKALIEAIDSNTKVVKKNLDTILKSLPVQEDGSQETEYAKKEVRYHLTIK